MENVKKAPTHKDEAGPAKQPHEASHTAVIKSQVLAKIGRPPHLRRVEVCKPHHGKCRVNIWEQPEPQKNIAVTPGPRIGLSYYLTVSDTGAIIHSNPPLPKAGSLGQQRARTVSAGNAAAIEDGGERPPSLPARRTAATKAYRAKIESLLDEASDEPLANVWRWVCPFPVDSAREVPDRRGIIQDLADFVEVLQPSLDGMTASQLCRLIGEYAACESRRSYVSVSLLARLTGTLNC